MTKATRHGFSRRSFLKGVAVTGAASAVLGTKPILGALQRGASAAPATQEKWVHTSCINCPAVCPMRVKVQDGRAVHIEGNPLSKVTNGAICAKGLLN
ncbi:MAG: twin-arginine translocation signal domain-containing protein, partial [Bacillota bacterium]